MKKGIAIGVVLLALVACKKEKNTFPDQGYGYFPDEVGKYVVYDVDSIVYDDFNGSVDTFRFQVKEHIQSMYFDNSSRKTQRIERFKKIYNKNISYSNLPWVLSDVWAANRTATTAEKVEENIRYVKLAFTVQQGKKWNGNAQNTATAQDYEYTEVNVPASVASCSFDSTLTVTQLDKENLIEKQYYKEVYAKNVGLVYKQVIDVKSKVINQQYIMDRISSGLIYTMKVNSFGSH